ncbi:hypothetical protein RDI58_028674 [Solanum bulbocastanum]|uniref:Uncharacterized protein n=1 Tax=Solanum bulbocastanum TaxID=147425 RepID=A0AAN8SWS6_SOLBU
MTIQEKLLFFQVMPSRYSLHPYWVMNRSLES